ncbi:hypothetical protein SAMN05216315_11212 [Nitrosospira sp. Nsp18]|uniref:hypothetical protein n=1 Tax=Nitrosospira sp. Nsp18 TaxID=1855334 RepID=UPI00089189A0|nr:hypothetical protein [Nitrosospira sp. Nsp18]SDA19600.1 hypothetical protein SAMN05216315_11212 [Nitrosospira sp. Nsp18]
MVAAKYEVPANIALAVVEKESGMAVGTQLERDLRCRPDAIQYRVSFRSGKVWHYRNPCRASRVLCIDLAT